MCGDCTCIAYGIWSIVYSMSVFELCQLSRYFSFDLVVAICHQSQTCQVSLDDPTMIRNNPVTAIAPGRLRHYDVTLEVSRRVHFILHDVP